MAYDGLITEYKLGYKFQFQFRFYKCSKLHFFFVTEYLICLVIWSKISCLSMDRSKSNSLNVVWNRWDNEDDEHGDSYATNFKGTNNRDCFDQNKENGCRSKKTGSKIFSNNQFNKPRGRDFSQNHNHRRSENKSLKNAKSSQDLNKACKFEDTGLDASKYKNKNFSYRSEQNSQNKNKQKIFNARGLSSTKREVKCMRFFQVQKLTEKSPNEILLTIRDNDSGFILLLKEKIERNLMAYVLLALGKAVNSDMNQVVTGMIHLITSNTNFFLINIQQYLASFHGNKSDHYHLKSLVSLTEFLQKFQICLPSNASDALVILLPLLKITCEKYLLDDMTLHSLVCVKLQEIEEQNKFFFEKYTPNEIKKASQSERLQLMDPPEDFRSIPVLPNENDLLQPCSFLRPNLTKGRYNNTEHYLDVQYRLLREDYVKPLRDGISEYLTLKKQNKSLKKCKDVRIYPDVQILKEEFVNGSLVHMAFFNDKKFAKIKWDFSKRFLTGSLLCLSSDDFQTMFFAVVARREPKELSKGLLILRFEELTDAVLNLNPLTKFVVIETSAYFEAYRYNLNALLDLNEDSLPLKNYIIETQNIINKPQYLKETTTYDMRPLLMPLHNQIKIDKQGNIHNINCPAHLIEKVKNVTVLKENCWPTCSELNLDPSQYAALKAAITKEFAVIQGPPGTGKTYIGLRIAQLLLHNVKKWQSETNPSPILVICYTNHALDQFLEGLLHFTKQIVRIGGRSKSEEVSQYQVNNLKKIIRAKREVPHYIFSCIKQKNSELYGLKREIDQIRKRIDASASSVFSERELMNYMLPAQYSSLKRIGLTHKLRDDGRFIEDWLGIRFRTPNDFEIIPKEKVLHHYLPQPSIPVETNNLLEGDEDSDAECDIEYIEAQRDIDSEEFADVSYEVPQYDNEFDFTPVVFENDWQVQGGKKQIKKYIQNCLKYSEAMHLKEANQIKDVWLLPIEHRWRLYKFWLQYFIKTKIEEATKLQELLRKEFNELCEMRTEEDIYVCKQALVVGMTTTGAAKYRHIVQNLNPKIVIVEEAAEILESHIVTSLTSETQHMILIGDHQQLRPNPTVYLLATKYNLNVSLFERMIQNGLECYSLNIQHRMRPEIASLLVPHIYANLQNHESVKKFQNIKGICKNVFFITHSYNELQEEDSKSKVNEHEAKFLVKLCRYIILQGYKPCQITVLTTYSGQLFELKRQSEKSFLREVKFTVVDNYQGEENDIILVSFVRSNEDGEIGFLKVSNRVCVALSRAKKGLFCIGNFNLLANKSDLWKNIVDTLKEDNAIGPSLQLTCQNHPGVSSVVESDTDFDSVPEGGCSRKCEYRLLCGHVCALMCHPYDPKHEEIRCLKPCTKNCSEGHLCPKKCYEECGDCTVLVPKTIEKCGHVSNIPCHLQYDDIKCKNLCDEYLSCGHMCTNICSDPCVSKCMEKIKITSPLCSHKVVIACSEYENFRLLSRICKEPCRTLLTCGHMCKGSCGKCRQGRLHVACEQPCKRILVCGHECKSPCSENCPPCQEPCENECCHSKCPKTCGEPCEKCTEPCLWACEHKKCNMLCGEPCDRTACNEPCAKLLECGHQCIGVCNDPCLTQCRECNEKEVKEIFFGSEDEAEARFICLEDCKHIFELEGITQWMNNDDRNKGEIQMKVCPRCKTVVRKSLRFGNIVKSCLKNIEKVKKITYGDRKRNIEHQKILYRNLKASGKILELSFICEPLINAISSPGHKSIQQLTVIENMINISLSLIDVTWHRHEGGIPSFADNTIQNSFSRLSKYVEDIKKWLILFVQNEFLTASQQQLKELSWEVHRLKLADKLLGFIKDHTQMKVEAKMQLDKLLQLIITYAPFQETEINKFKSEFQYFAEMHDGAVINISDLEKQCILKAMDLSIGHWYQCPNGHVYCITECGGAMVESHCNECGAKIGGSSHRLLSDNRVATDMDGATHSAWSDAMNMDNYRF
ncbi:NFX1-type zinc finger-containing protein 1 [Trichonephila inaurata madagascariensis]|uniref:NFX1-type zinc finger-containing protein 1 n=1 Tax=Trichonephila inaurata madagascariensis TaxID=2747483 RepID=A0A8X6I2P2_9ARAC|nr:NFX1-type zinc finger-containing protein 1 [Trichonephila inaurata madagascariensis]